MDLVGISFLVVRRSRASEVCNPCAFDLSRIVHSFRTPLDITLFPVKDVDFSDEPIVCKAPDPIQIRDSFSLPGYHSPNPEIISRIL